MSMSHPSDEELSAHLDGEAPEFGDHVAGCPACRGRLDALRGVATLIATPPPPPDAARRDDAIAAALARPARSNRRLALVAAAAAIVLVAGIATPLLLRGGGHRTTTALSTANKDASGTAAGESQVAAGAAGESRAAAGSAASPAVSPVDGGDLGDQSDPAALGALVARAAPAPPASFAAPSCTPPGGGDVVYRARLRWKGTAAQVFGIEPGRRLVVMDSARCQVLVDQHF